MELSWSDRSFLIRKHRKENIKYIVTQHHVHRDRYEYCNHHGVNRGDRRHGDCLHGYLHHGDLHPRVRDGANRKARYRSARHGVHLWTCNGRGWMDPQQSVQFLEEWVIPEPHGDSPHHRDGGGRHRLLLLCVDLMVSVEIPPFSLRMMVRLVCCGALHRGGYLRDAHGFLRDDCCCHDDHYGGRHGDRHGDRRGDDGAGDNY